MSPFDELVYHGKQQEEARAKIEAGEEREAELVEALRVTQREVHEHKTTLHRHTVLASYRSGLYYRQPDGSLSRAPSMLEVDPLGSHSGTLAPRVLYEGSVSFNEAESALICGSSRCELVRIKRVHHLCRIMFGRAAHALVSWDEVYMELVALEDAEDVPIDADGKRKAKKMITDTILRANKHFKHCFNTPQELFRWEAGSVIRLL